MNTMVTMADGELEIFMGSTSSKHHLLDEQEAARLRENVAFWREKVDMLLQEKRDSIQEAAELHRQIRGLEEEAADQKIKTREKDIQID